MHVRMSLLRMTPELRSERSERDQSPYEVPVLGAVRATIICATFVKQLHDGLDPPARRKGILALLKANTLPGAGATVSPELTAF